MSAETQAVELQDEKLSNKELNFRALESKYQKELERERAEKLEYQRLAQEALNRSQKEEDDDQEPYVDHKKLEKKLAKFGENTKKETRADIQQAVQAALEQERQNAWLEANPDFYDIMNEHSAKLPTVSPELAKTILKMPDGFDRQKLVYANIKALGLHKPPEKQSSIQDKVDANRRNQYYQPSGVAPPFSNQGDFSPEGQKAAYLQIQKLKENMRL
jgi:post-segregation antitoxin (ccd killing protein)